MAFEIDVFNLEFACVISDCGVEFLARGGQASVVLRFLEIDAGALGERPFLRNACDGLVCDGDNPFGFFADAACDIAIDAGADACNKSQATEKF